jgi:cellulose synthase/poly-beta-1,6-N-acetylglucosamine synthase-like glycosyltransferase
VIIVDNDAEMRGGAALVDQVAATFRFRLTCIVEPDRGHTYAYNRAFSAACRVTPSPDYIAVLDDDEFPDPNWLTEMIRVSCEYGADIVGGPVFPVFDRPDHWLAQSGFYAPVRHATGPVPMIYGAGNMLIRRDVLEQYLDEPFLHAFAFTGASDYDFFWRCRIDGRSFAWADNAEVFETTPPSRTTISYLLRRKFRNGSEATRLERKFLGRLAGAVRGWYIGLGLLGLGLLSLPVAALRGRRAMMGSLMQTAKGAGRLAAKFDLHYEQYR